MIFGAVRRGVAEAGKVSLSRAVPEAAFAGDLDLDAPSTVETAAVAHEGGGAGIPDDDVAEPGPVTEFVPSLRQRREAGHPARRVAP